jgi:HlyD family secretion protein/adhesin transport system membrane fusion protein
MLVQKRQSQITRLLSTATLLEEKGPPRALCYLLLLICLLVGGFIVFSVATEITEAAVVHGEVVPEGSVNVVQHLEGGIISQVLVEEGQVVQKGQPLVRLDEAAARAELDQIRALETSLVLRTQRLRAFVMGREPHFSASDRYADLVEDQYSVLEMQLRAHESQRQVLESRIQQRAAHIAALEDQKTHLQEQMTISRQLLEMRKKLLDKGLVSRVTYLETERQLSRVHSELTGIVGQIAEAQAALGEARNSLLELDAQLRNKALEETGHVTEELAQVREKLARAEDRVARLEIDAPVRGIVKGLRTKTIGGVVRPGETLMELVPLGDALVADVKIAPRDIGHVAIGQPAKVKVSTYDSARFGDIDGTLKHISASTFQEDRGKAFYKGIIELSKDYVGNDPAANPILPGMVVDADIVTGHRSLFRYLLKPVYRGLDSSFHER